MVSKNPFLQYPVIQKLLSCLPAPEVLKIRQVCKLWKEEGNRQLKNRLKIRIVGQIQLKQFLLDVSDIEEGSIRLTNTFHLESIDLDTSEALAFFEQTGAGIETLAIKFCDWTSQRLRTALFDHLPRLQSLSISRLHSGQYWLEPLMPMSRVLLLGSLRVLGLRELKLTGDYSTRTDLFYDLLKYSPKLESIHFSKHHPRDDDLFGTWLMEIIFSCDFVRLTSLEVECTLIQQQMETLMRKEYPLKRLSIELDEDVVEYKSIDNILGHFPFLESVEIGVQRLSRSLVNNSLLVKFKHSNCWIAIHTCPGSRIVIPNEAVLES